MSISGRDQKRLDVIILGAGIAGTILGSILGRHGLSVLILEDSEHPRFAIGESSIPEFTLRMLLASVRFDVPELSYLSNFYDIRDRIGSNHGVKRAFSFLYHREGREQIPTESVQVPTLHPPFGPDAHVYRQELDSYYLNVAIRYGVTVVQKVNVKSLELTDHQVCARTEKHGDFCAKYIADAGGMRSPLAAALNLRETPSRYHTKSRAIYSHFIDVLPYDQLNGSRRAHGLPYPLSQSTLHHLFDGGWFWIIPFNNHPRATNPLCSVGLLLDLHRFPSCDYGSPEEEFRSFVARFPSVAKQFEKARPVRSFAATGQLQYSSSKVVGHRWCLTSHAGAFIDPLFSSGLMITIGTITLLADALLKAFREDDFQVERFSAVEDFIVQSFQQTDRVVSASYVSFRDFELWNAWARVYMTGVLFGAISPLRCYLKYLSTGERSYLEDIDRLPYRGVAGSGFAETQKIFDPGFAELMKVRDEGAEPKEVVEKLFALLRTVDFMPPSFQIANAKQRHPTVLTLPQMWRDASWTRKQCPPWVREALFDWPPTTYIRHTLSGIGRQVGRSLWRCFDPMREVLSTWNPHW